jgi:hypothetical protein
MKVKHLILALLALSPMAAQASISYGSAGRMTLNLRYTTPGESRTTLHGTSQRLDTTRFGNRELLEYLVDAEVISTIKGYTLVERYDQGGASMHFGVLNVSTGHLFPIPLDILEELESFGVGARSENTRNNSWTYTSKWQSSAVLCDSALSIFRNILYTTTSGKFNGQTYDFISAGGAGTVHGANEGRNFVIEGTLNIARSTLYVPTLKFPK